MTNTIKDYSDVQKYLRENTLYSLSSCAQNNVDLVNTIYSVFLNRIQNQESVSSSLLLKALMMTPLNQRKREHTHLYNYVDDLDGELSIRDSAINGETYLHRVAFFGRIKPLKTLLAQGANVNSTTLKGSTPLHFAAEKGEEECVDALLKARATVDIKTNNGGTALGFAALSGSIGTITKLRSAMNLNHSLCNLEEDLIAEIDVEVDVETPPPFHDCLTPNEYPNGLSDHINLVKEGGIAVSCGTERSFFNLIATSRRINGLVIRDINPRVKAYMDFNILLMRISNDVYDYQSYLSQKPDLDWLKVKICHTPLSEKLIAYYLKNLENFANVFYGMASQNWRYVKDDEILEKFAYHNTANYRLFNRLKNCAEWGKIAVTIGPINDLRFLKDYKISLVDVSNIPAYSYIDLRILGDSTPRVLFTRFDEHGRNSYFSHTHQPISEEERVKFEDLLKRICAYTHLQDSFDAVHEVLNKNTGKNQDIYQDYHGTFINRKSIEHLKKIFKSCGPKE